MIVLITVFLCGLLRIITVAFLFLLMKDELNASKTIMGIGQGFEDFTSFIVFPFTRKITMKLGGPVISLELSLVTVCVSHLMISFIQNPSLMLIPQFLNGGTNGLFRSTFVQHTTEISPKEVYNTMFSLTIACYMGVAGAASNFAGGAVYHAYGGRTVFRAACVLGGIWLIVMILFFHVRCKGHDSSSTDIGENAVQMNTHAT